jgi:hypothetical protein
MVNNLKLGEEWFGHRTTISFHPQTLRASIWRDELLRGVTMFARGGKDDEPSLFHDTMARAN